MDLEKISKEIKKEAELFLKDFCLIDMLSKYGEVVVRGSYELDLMMDGDIDIYVINKKLDKKLAISALNEFVSKDEFRGYFFYNFVKRRKKGFPKGYYIGIKTKYKNRKWKLDIWFMKEMDKCSDDFMKYVKKNLTDKKRKEILTEKFKIKNSIKKPKTSFDVYSDVLGGYDN